MEPRPITKLLVANRGEIARRVFRTCREMGIATVAVFSDADADAAFVSDADEAVPLGGLSPAESYLRGEAVIAAAIAVGADAVHPGYGFLSENAGFAQACLDAGLIFVGPAPAAIAAMGSKVEAKRTMAAAGVPLLPSAELGADVASVDWEAASTAADSMGWPVLVKASAGGGGRGMRVVDHAGDLADAVASAMREAASAFGDGTVFVEPYIGTSRHVEVQIFGDSTGRVIHLYERDCSIQRRHQKVIEESPSPAIDPATRASLCEAAVAAGRAIGYQNAGTVEFLLAPDGRFFFLEVNTRLQVEHPVTEAVTGLDLVRLQIEVAGGAELPDQTDVPAPSGHAIEARIYAEDPAADYRPSTGHLHRFEVDSAPTRPRVYVEATPTRLRVDSAYHVGGGAVTHHYDPMLAKVIAHAPTRGEAARRLAAGLAAARIHGLRTNRDQLVAVLRHPEFVAGRADSRFLADHPDLGRPDPRVARLHAAVAALAQQAVRRAAGPVLAAAPPGYRNVPTALQEVEFDVEGQAVAVGYRVERSGVALQIDGAAIEGVRAHRIDPDVVEITIEDVRRRYLVSHVGDRAWVDSSLGSSEVVEVPRFADPAEAAAAAGSLVAPMPGTVVAVHVAVGDHVEAGAPLVTLEAMKMELVIRAPHPGQVTALDAAPGQPVAAGTILAVLL